MKRWRLEFYVLGFALFLFSSALGRPVWPKGSERLISPSAAVEIARRHAPGDVVSKELVRPKNGDPYYRVKLIFRGRMNVVDVNAVTGGE